MAGLLAKYGLEQCNSGHAILLSMGHSIIFAWPELRKLHQRRSALARDVLIKQLRDYQDWSGVRVVVVFDGRGSRVGVSADPGEVQIFYSRRGQAADEIVERLAGKYAGRFDVVVATADAKEQATVNSFGASCVSTEGSARFATASPPASSGLIPIFKLLLQERQRRRDSSAHAKSPVRVPARSRVVRSANSC